MPYITVKQAATLAGVSTRTMHRLIAAGTIPARHHTKRALTVLSEDVTHYVSQKPVALPSEQDILRDRVAALEARVDALETIATATARDAPTRWPASVPTKSETVAQSVSERLPAGLPAGSMIASKFAKKHKGVIVENTLLRHLADERYPAVNGVKIGRFRWMTPQQQAEALAFYRGE